jgi:hypothetical protein
LHLFLWSFFCFSDVKFLLGGRNLLGNQLSFLQPPLLADLVLFKDISLVVGEEDCLSLRELIFEPELSTLMDDDWPDGLLILTWVRANLLDHIPT